MSCIVEGSALGRAIEGSAASVVPRKSFSYCKLPQQRQLLKLTVLKLDGTCFDVQVARTASVGELKQAVEDVFNQSPKEDHRKISWSHVWGHFCLCYEGYKLINDKEFLRDFGIRDGDQLNFMRHLSLYHIPEDRPKKHTAAHRQRRSSAGFDDKRQNEDGEKYGNDEDIIEQNGFKLSHFLRGWLSCWRLWFMGRLQSEGKGYFKRIASNSHLSGERQDLRLPQFYGTP
ncbi:uncharacterized protein LOC116253596 isoform X1 [Nymphaea colorata]|nr:uncharacterized protein LOC116253596 isoform X1 [Nymphaea colorata]